jgi:hypothetical protein|tara:strand:- start:139 stop:318 length:180 start_codon:yes stop_codon:yes gene_type:complete
LKEKSWLSLEVHKVLDKPLHISSLGIDELGLEYVAMVFCDTEQNFAEQLSKRSSVPIMA